MKSTFFKLVLVTALLTSCSDYNKILKGDDYNQKFTLANNLFEREKWMQSVALYEQVYQRAPKSGEGELAYYRLGKAHFEDGDYYMAGYYFGSFFEKFPYSPKTEEAFFLKALCSVKNSPASSLDQQETELALNDVQQFIYLFPKSSKIDTCNAIMDQLRSKMELKEYENIKLYAKTENFRAATTTSETFLVDYPTSKFKEEVMYILIKNNYSISKNSVEDKKKERIEKTIETYRTFVSLFPTSEYLKELGNMEEILKEQLNSLSNSK